MKLSLKLGAFCAAVTALPLLIISAFALSAFSSYSHTQAVEQLKKDARAAARMYEKRLDAMRAAAQQLAVDVANKALVSTEAAGQESGSAWARLQDMLPRAQNDFNLDFLIIADQSGRVIARHNDRPAAGELVTGMPGSEDKNLLAERVLNDGFQLRNLAQASAVIERGERLKRLGLDSVAEVRSGDEVKTGDALMIEACAPIFSGGRFVGVVLTGQMLNNYYAARAGAAPLQTPLVAEVKQTLAPANVGAGAVVALQNTIVASSLVPAGSKPLLLGASCNPRQEMEELSAGGSDYLLAWQPISASDGLSVGALGVALDEAAIGGAGTALKFSLLVISLIATLSAGAAGFLVGRNLATRVAALTEAANRMSLGELSAPIRDDAFSEQRRFGEFFLDEVNQLTYQLDEMRESFRQAIERLKKR